MSNVVPFNKKPVAAVCEIKYEPLSVSTLRLAEALLTIMVVDKDKEAVEQALQLFADAVMKSYTEVYVTSQPVLKYSQYLESGHGGYEVVCKVMGDMRIGNI